MRFSMVSDAPTDRKSLEIPGFPRDSLGFLEDSQRFLMKMTEKLEESLKNH